jgi:hypothetical protein
MEVYVNVYINKPPILISCSDIWVERLIESYESIKDKYTLMSLLKYVLDNNNGSKNRSFVNIIKRRLCIDDVSYTSIRPKYKCVEDILSATRIIDKRSGLTDAFYSMCGCKNHFDYFNPNNNKTIGIIQYPSKRDALNWVRKSGINIIETLDDIHKYNSGIIIDVTRFTPIINGNHMNTLVKYTNFYLLEPYIYPTNKLFIKLLNSKGCNITVIPGDYYHRKAILYHNLFQFLDEIFSSSRAVLFTDKHSVADLCRHICEARNIFYSYYSPKSNMQNINFSPNLTIIEGKLPSKLKNVPGKLFFHLTYKLTLCTNMSKIRNVKQKTNKQIGIFLESKKENLPSYDLDLNCSLWDDLLNTLKDKLWKITFSEEPRNRSDFFGFKNHKCKNICYDEYKRICKHIKELHAEKMYLGVEEDDPCFHKIGKVRNVMSTVIDIDSCINISKMNMFVLINRCYILNNISNIKAKDNTNCMTGRISLRKISIVKVNEGLIYTIAKMLYSINCLKSNLLSGKTNEKFIDKNHLNKVKICERLNDKLITYFSPIRCVTSWPSINDTLEYLKNLFEITIGCTIVSRDSKLYFTQL